MKNIRTYLIGAAFGAVVMLMMGQAAQPGKGPRWEYLYVEQRWMKFEPVNLEGNGARLLQAKLMNELGSEGWDVIQAGTGGYLFRRAIR